MGSMCSPERINKIEGYSALSDRLRLIWVKTHSKLHNRLSFNIIREICAYQGNNQQLIVVLEAEFRFFHISTDRSRRIPLRKKIQVDSSTFSTLITRDKVVVCGGKSQYVLEGNGTVVRLPEMHMARGYSGIVYNAETTTAYVFGGLVPESEYSLQTCEKIVFECPHLWPTSLKWELLPPMNRPRAYFNPCLHVSIVYISGGGSWSMETYNLTQDRFSLIFDFGLHCDGPSMVVKESDTLVVMHVNSVFLWSLRQSCMISSQDRAGICFWSKCPVVLGDGVLYGLNEDRCQAINIQTGEVQEDKSAIDK